MFFLFILFIVIPIIELYKNGREGVGGRQRLRAQEPQEDVLYCGVPVDSDALRGRADDLWIEGRAVGLQDRTRY